LPVRDVPAAMTKDDVERFAGFDWVIGCPTSEKKR
jgi:hypothetical protein